MSAEHVFFIENPTLEKRHHANMFFLSEIQHQKSYIRRTSFFHQKYNVIKLMSSQHVFFIGNLTLENQCWVNVFFIGILCLKYDVEPMCFFHLESDIGKVMSGLSAFLIVNLTSEKRHHANMFFLSEIQHQKSYVRCTSFFHQKYNVIKLTSGQYVFFIFGKPMLG